MEQARVLLAVHVDRLCAHGGLQVIGERARGLVRITLVRFPIVARDQRLSEAHQGAPQEAVPLLVVHSHRDQAHVERPLMRGLCA